MTDHRKPRKYTREILEPLVAESTSVAGVLRLLGLRQNGGAHAHISRTIKRFQIDTSHFVRYPGTPGAGRRPAEDILVVLHRQAPRAKPRRLTRALIEIGREYRCETCGCDGMWNGLPLTLEVDHIDGNFLDNRAGNLRFLCPNCHRQTPNFAGRSKGRFAAEPTA